MKPKIVNRETITVLGVQDRLKHMEEGVPQMWEVRFMAHHDAILPLSTDKVYYGPYLPTGDAGPLDYLAAMAVAEGTQAPEGLTLCQVPEARWSLFECTVATIGQTVDAIFQEWLPAAPYEHVGPNPDAFERYPPQTNSGNTPVLVHIKVRRKGASDG